MKAITEDGGAEIFSFGIKLIPETKKEKAILDKLYDDLLEGSGTELLVLAEKSSNGALVVKLEDPPNRFG